MSDWPSCRKFPFENSAELQSLKQAWDYSSEQLANLADVLTESRLPAEVSCVAVSGSLARMEAHRGSDVDVLVVYDDRQTTFSADAAGQAYDLIWSRLASSAVVRGLKRPKPGGVFSEVARTSLLTNPDVRGIVDEGVTSYGQRMQLLLDSQPLYNADRFADLQRRLLNWYIEDRIAQQFHEAGPFHWMWQDIQRYWRSIRARACWLHADQPRKSLEVNLKLRSSRLAIIVSILWAIERCHDHQRVQDCIESLQTQLRRTPAERLVDAVGSQSSQRMLIAYQTIWQYTSQLREDTTTPNEFALQAIQEFNTCLRSITGGRNDWTF